MGVVMPAMLQLMKLCVIGFALAVQGSTDSNISPSPASFSLVPPIEETPGPAYHRKSWRTSAPSSSSQPNGSDSHPPLASPPLTSSPLPGGIQGLVPSLSPSTPTVSPPYKISPPPLTIQGHVPSIPPSPSPFKKTAASMPVAAPVATPRNLPQNSPVSHPGVPGTLSPSSHQSNAPDNKAPMPEPITPVTVASPPRKVGQNPPAVRPNKPDITPSVLPVPVASPPSKLPQNSPVIHPVMPGESPSVLPGVPGTLSPSSHQSNAPDSKAPIPEPITPVTVASPPRKVGRNPPAVHPNMPEITPSVLPVPVASPPSKLPRNSPVIHPVMPGESPSVLPDPDVSPASTPPSSIGWKRNRIPEAAPPRETPKPLTPGDHSPAQAPSTHKDMSHSAYSPAPSILSPKSPLNKGYHSPAPPPTTSFYKHHHTRNKITSPAPTSSYPVSSPTTKQQGPVVSPALPPTRGPKHYAPSPLKRDPDVSPASTPPSSIGGKRNRVPEAAPPHETFKPSPPLDHAPAQGPVMSPGLLPTRRRTHYAPPPLMPVSRSHVPLPSPISNVSPAPSPPPKAASSHTKMPLLPPNVSPSGSKSPKMPVLPPLKAFPPPPPNEDCSLITCTEPYTNTPPGSPCGCVRPMQVGLLLSVDLYTFFPLVSELAKETAAGVFMKQSQVRITGANADSQQAEKTIVNIDLVPLDEKFDSTTAMLIFQRFWHKQVVIKSSYFGDYEVLYVRYQGLPPSPPLPSEITIIDGGPYSGTSNARTNKPLGVDVQKGRHNNGLSGGIIAIIALSAFVGVVLCSAAAWVVLFKHRNNVCGTVPTAHTLPPLTKPSGLAGSLMGSGPSSASLSFGSSIPPYTGSAKTFSMSDIEKATDNFDVSRILGEGGFGLVYSGVLEDGIKVAVKVLKRDDQQGGREFLAEVEMLSRLHHRNLVKLIGICTEERARSLVYELIPNGSVESHLHGVDKETAPLDWAARMKIALGAARGLAYLHEDSSPRVIHRDFKSSNILLEHDFTPKVSDFGLARTALDEENRHISTRVMGTFGYVAPEYAMTGHLLVKSDVYSYGVVLLELLTGRKPVDMSQPPGQENLVAWARPLLTSKEGLETMIDASLGSDVPFDSIAKVAAIASMCVQPEVSHRPFMGEVVQALKLVCNECDEAKIGSRCSSQEDLSIDMDAGVVTGSGQLPDPLPSDYFVPNFNSGIDTERGLSVSDLFSSSARLERQASGSFRRYCSSGPLRTGRGRHFWQRIRRLSGGSVSEHGVMFRLWPGSH